MKNPRLTSGFLKLFGDTPTNRVWDHLILSRELFDLSMTNISEGSGISWNTLKKIFPFFLEEKLVVESRNVGRATMYRLNMDSPRVAFMVRVHGEASKLQAKRTRTSAPKESA
jgi:hypothetical protein